MFESVFSASLFKQAIKKELLRIKLYNLRDWGLGVHRQVDDRPYGGGAGMVIRIDVVDHALRDLKFKISQRFGRDPDLTSGQNHKFKTILLTPRGKVFNQKMAQKLSKENDLILICGHYEGFDERIRKLADEEISIGDYILMGGEIPAMVLVDAISRFIPGFLGKPQSLEEESFEKRFLEYPQYTRPEDYREEKVPRVLLSGNHQKIKEWRQKEAFKTTKKMRPDLLK